MPLVSASRTSAVFSWRARELVLIHDEQIDPTGQRVCVVYGVPGVRKVPRRLLPLIAPAIHRCRAPDTHES